MTATLCAKTGSSPKHDFKAAVSRFSDTFQTDHKIGIAVSGGSDSTGLLVALSQSTDRERLVALTVDHGLRAGSHAEAVDVGQLCQTFGIRHEILRWQGDKPATGVQAAARDARYRLLSDAAGSHQLAAIVTAHTANDQAETLVMRKQRAVAGDEGPGVAGIPPATLAGGSVWFLRPLLNVERGSIRSFLDQHGTGWLDDPSNEDDRFERVRVRKANPALGASLAPVWQARLDRAKAVASILDAHANRDDNDCFTLETEGICDELLQAALAVMIDVAGGRARGLDRNGRDRLREFVATPSQSRVTLGRTIVARSSGRISLRRERRNVAKLSLKPGGEGEWDGRYRIAHEAVESKISASITVRGDDVIGILPEFVASYGDNLGNEAYISLERLCGRASRLLPVFELSQANAMARICGRQPFPACPWKNWMASASD